MKKSILTDEEKQKIIEKENIRCSVKYRKSDKFIKDHLSIFSSVIIIIIFLIILNFLSVIIKRLENNSNEKNNKEINSIKIK